MHPAGSLVVGAVAGALFVWTFTLCQNKWKIDDVLGVWPLHGLCGVWGGIACGIFGSEALGGMGGVSFMAQLVGSLLGVAIALGGGFIVYGVIKSVMGIRLSQEDEPNQKTLAAINNQYRSLGGDVLGIIPDESRVGTVDAQRQEGLIRLLIGLRAEARARKDWTASDQIRDSLSELGITLEDRADGTVWKIG